MVIPSDVRPNHFLLGCEFVATLLAVALAFVWPRLGAKFFEGVERSVTRIAQRKSWAVAGVGASGIVLRAALLPLFPIPSPFVSDDFSFLLASDTFARGRLANPTPAMWTHFESIHITMQPTYQSMYFPGQGLMLAAGQVLFGQPWLAELVMDGLMCAGLVWMLQGWLPRRWALLGGVLAVLRLGLFSVWINSLHTAALPSAFGGALVLGSLPRVMKAGRFRSGMSMSIGIAILVLTRPYEGVLLCLPVAVALGHWIFRGKNRPTLSVLTRRAVAPLLVVGATLAWLGYYDYRAFGSPLTLPYTIDRAEYAVTPYYVWQRPHAVPVYRHAAMRDFYEGIEFPLYERVHSLKGFLPATVAKAVVNLLFYAGLCLLPPLFMVRRVFLDRRVRFLVVCVVVLACGMVIEIYVLPYYLAPFTAAFYAIGLQMMRHLRVWKSGRSAVGLALVRFMVVACLVMAAVRVVAEPLHLGPPEWDAGNWDFVWFGPQHFGGERAQIESGLDELPGGQLALVRYGRDHNPQDEWVFNGADIDGSKVIWARDMEAADNLELIHYYPNRRVWLVEPDAIPARIEPYPAQRPQ